MRIVHFIKWLRLRDGGTVRAVLDMCAGLAGQGHEVVAMSADDSGVSAEWKREPWNGWGKGERGGGVKSVVIGLRDPIWELRGRRMEEATRDTPTQYVPRAGIARAREVLRGADVLHVHGVWANCNYQMMRIAKGWGVPYVISPHGMLDDWSMAQGTKKKRLLLALAGRRALEGARAVHCTARAELTQARKWFPNGRGMVVPLLFDTQPFEALPGPGPALEAYPILASGRPSVLFLSRLHVKKGVEQLVAAAAALKAAGTPVTLLLAGPSDPPEYEAHLRSMVRSAGIEETTQFLGMVTGSVKWSLYQASDVFVLPTSQENFGYVLLEALACGTPVVTTRGVDIWPELEASGGAVICEGGGLAEKLTLEVGKLLADGPRRAAMGWKGRDWALSFLDRGRILEAMEGMYSGNFKSLGFGTRIPSE